MVDIAEDFTGAAMVEQAPRTVPEPPEPDLDFWETRPALRHTRDFAYARMCSPWAVLGVTILHALHYVPPWVTLPPWIGGRGSLNLFAALVGSAGSGKNAAEAAAADAFDMGDEPVYVAAAGSGEGITHQYAHREKGEIVSDRNAAIFTAAEVDQLMALHTRQGSTLTSQLRSAFMGERLGFAYADASRRIPLGAHSYRLGLIVGVQPERAAMLLGQGDGGTPQRFIWLPATDPGVTADPPAEPYPMRIDATRRSWKSGPMTMPDEARQDVLKAHVARQRGDGHALDGHALFSREKVAVALTLLDDRRIVNPEDWALAGRIMAKSDRTRTSIEAVLSRKAEAAGTAKAMEEGRRDVVKGQYVRDDEIQRTCQAIVRKLGRGGGWMPRNIVRSAVAAELRRRFDEAVDRLLETGQIEVEDGPSGMHLRLSEGVRR